MIEQIDSINRDGVGVQALSKGDRALLEALEPRLRHRRDVGKELRALLARHRKGAELAVGRQERLRAARTQQGRDADKIAALIAKNQQLTSALHRTACAG